MRDNGPAYTQLDQLQGRRIAVQIGTTGALAAGQVPGAKVSSFDSTPLALQELANGNADAVVSDVPAILYAINQAKLAGLRISGEHLSTEFYGIALPIRSPITAEVNRGLEALITSGRYAALYRQWFAADPPVLPEVAPSAQAAASPLAGLDVHQLTLNLFNTK